MCMNKLNKNITSTLEDKINSGAINGAVTQLKQMAETRSDWEAIGRLNGISESYKYLCKYFLDGTPDPTRHRMLEELAEQLREVRDRIVREGRSESPDAYYASLRMSRLRNYNLTDLLKRYRELMSRISLAESTGEIPADMNEERYRMLEEIFTATMVSFQSKSDIRAIKEMMEDPDTDTSLRIQIVSALTLGLLAWYDSARLKVLSEICVQPDIDTDVRAHAIAGTIFVLMAHGDRARRNEAIISRLRVLADMENGASMLRTTVKAIAGTCDTKRVGDKMANEVIPEIMKMRPDILRKIKDLKEEADPESLENNPEWQEMLDKSGLARKLEELYEMQNDGADLMMVTFSRLKEFPFFRDINNWFLPFDVHNPHLARLDNETRSMLERITDISPMICDSDKYSLAMGVMHTPESQRKMMMSQFDAQFRQMSQELADKLPESSSQDYEHSVVKAVREFYRYAMLGRNTGAFGNPFLMPLDFTSLPEIGTHLADETFMNVMAEFYFKREFWQDALRLFDKISEEYNTTDSTMWQKIGFCRQKLRDYTGARSAYMKSELLGDESRWLTRHLAYVNRRLGDYASAQEYYDKALKYDPDNVSLILKTAATALEGGDAGSALAHYQHANYLRPDNVDAMRGMAWTEMLTGDMESSENIYSALLLDSPTASDWLNAGHVALLRGRYRTALERYRKAIEPSADDFRMVFDNDMATLTRLGADSDAIRLLRDMIE